MKVLITVLLTVIFLFAKDIKPLYEFEASGNVIDIVVKKNLLYAGCDNGVLEIIDWQKQKLKKEIKIPDIHDFMGDIIGAKIFSVDVSPDDSKVILLSQGESGARNLSIIENDQLKTVISEKEKLYISEARFIDNDTILIALLSNELILYDLKNRKQLYRTQLSQSTFADFALNEDKTKVAVGCESGEIFVVDTRNGKIIKILSGANLDKTFKVDFKSDKVLGAGQDRKGSVYDVKSGSYITFNANFLIYAGALSPDAKYAAFAYNENNDIAIFNTDSKAKEFVLIGQKSTLNTIVFYDENTLISASDDKYIMFWKTKESK